MNFLYEHFCIDVLNVNITNLLWVYWFIFSHRNMFCLPVDPRSSSATVLLLPTKSTTSGLEQGPDFSHHLTSWKSSFLLISVTEVHPVLLRSSSTVVLARRLHPFHCSTLPGHPRAVHWFTSSATTSSIGPRRPLRTFLCQPQVRSVPF